MSKASQFAQRLAYQTTIEIADRPVFKGTSGRQHREIAGVADTGGCYLKSLYIDAPTAIQLARWILDTFGEETP